jgi:hypothetical protein
MSMRKIREVLRLTHELGLSVREVREAAITSGRVLLPRPSSSTRRNSRSSATRPCYMSLHCNGKHRHLCKEKAF